jgi:hypothetical protein
MRSLSRFKRILATSAVAAVMAGGAVALSGAPAGALTLTNVSWSVGNTATSTANAPATNNTGVYTWTFTTATAYAAGANSLSQLTFTVPTGTSGGTTVGVTYGLSTCTVGTVTDSSGTVTVPLTTCPAIAVGTTISVQLTGFTNTTTAGTSSSAVTTYITATHTSTDTGTSNSNTFVSNSTAVNVIVPDSLSFTNNKPASITLTPVPGTAGIEANPGTLVVATNAHTGFTLAGCSGSLSGPGTAIPTLSTSVPVVAATFLIQATSGWGAEATVSGGAASLSNAWSATSYLGYGTNCSLAADNIISDTGPTAGDTLTVTNGAAVSPTQADGSYTGYINYLVTPGF